VRPVDADLSHRIEDVPERFVPDEMAGELVEAEHLARYWWASALADGRRVLDAGCGMGYGTNLMAAAGATEAVGVDVAEGVVEAARARAADRARFEAADVRELPFEDGAFDLVVCFEVIEHIESPADTLRELARVLAPDGVLVVSSPNPDVYVPGNPHHVHELRPDELRTMVSAELPNVEIYAQVNWVSSVVIAPLEVADRGLDAIAGLEGATVAEPDPAGAPYSVALAGRGALPRPSPRVVATGLAEPRRWLELYASQQEQLSGLNRELGRRADQHLELGTLHDELRRSELEIARLTGVEQRLDVAQAHLERMRAERIAEVEALQERLVSADRVLEAMRRSPSWRITKPLRALKRILR
jgi:2-polyprenyl-3-methyl-5-hydroxy-6-metoxy-1,4-benzoquinol methylase